LLDVELPVMVGLLAPVVPVAPVVLVVPLAPVEDVPEELGVVELVPAPVMPEDDWLAPLCVPPEESIGPVLDMPLWRSVLEVDDCSEDWVPNCDVLCELLGDVADDVDEVLCACAAVAKAVAATRLNAAAMQLGLNLSSNMRFLLFDWQMPNIYRLRRARLRLQAACLLWNEAADRPVSRQESVKKKEKRRSYRQGLQNLQPMPLWAAIVWRRST
jgi:hypothetical protein